MYQDRNFSPKNRLKFALKNDQKPVGKHLKKTTLFFTPFSTHFPFFPKLKFSQNNFTFFLIPQPPFQKGDSLAGRHPQNGCFGGNKRVMGLWSGQFLMLTFGSATIWPHKCTATTQGITYPLQALLLFISWLLYLVKNDKFILRCLTLVLTSFYHGSYFYI